MLLNSLQFLFFFAIISILYYSISHKFRWILLLVGSYFFYLCFGYKYLGFIAASTIVSFYSAQLIFKSITQKAKNNYLTLNILFNVSLLLFFKYYNFSADTLNTLFHLAKINTIIPHSHFLLTVGISFYTFQSMGYILDVYYEKREPENHLGIYALYISFFPKLVAGPIERSTNLLVQLHNKINFNYDKILLGLKMMLWGYFKKIVIADNLSIVIDKVYNTPNSHGGIEFIIVTILYAFQIYTDFSGYSDIAIGAGKILGFDLMQNFDRPLLSKSVSEFWRRWHISLSSWFRDYLFSPIIFNRKNWGNFALVYASFITFILCGLWHGPKWTFIVFGTLQGLLISYELLTISYRKKLAKKAPTNLYSFICLALTFSFVCFSMIFFRANSLHDAFYIISHFGSQKPVIADATSVEVIFGISNYVLLKNIFLLITYFLLSPFVFKILNSETTSASKIKQYLIFQTIMFLILLFGYFGDSNFIYLKF